MSDDYISQPCLIKPFSPHRHLIGSCPHCERDTLRAQLAAAESRAERLSAAALDVIEFNRQHAHDQYGDADKCETWACVRTLRAALAEGDVG